MPTYQNGFLAEILSGGPMPIAGEPIPAGQLAYFRERLKGRVFSFILKGFLEQQKENPELTQAFIARRLRRRPEQINRWLSGPSNMTLETISDLVLAVYGGEPSIAADRLKVNTQAPENNAAMQLESADADKTEANDFQFNDADWSLLSPEVNLGLGVSAPNGNIGLNNNGLITSLLDEPYLYNQSNQHILPWAYLQSILLAPSESQESTYSGTVHKNATFAIRGLLQERLDHAKTKEKLKRTKKQLERLEQELAVAKATPYKINQADFGALGGANNGNDNIGPWAYENSSRQMGAV